MDKLLMVIVPSECREQLEVLLNRQDVGGFTEIPGAHGIGGSGVRMGSAAHPQTSSVFFTVLPEDRVGPLRQEILNYCGSDEQSIKMIVWAVEEVA